MKKKTFLIMFLGMMPFLFTACSHDDAVKENENSETIVDDDFKAISADITLANSVTIAFLGDQAVINNPFADRGVSIVQNAGKVVVTSTITDTEVNYILSGTTKVGSFKIYSDYKFGLVLNGVDLVSTDGPAVNIQSGKKVSVNVVTGSANRLIDGTTYTAYNTEDMKGTLFSEGQLVFGGSGSLLVQARNKHAICSDDYIRIDAGNITIAGTVKDAIHSSDYFRMDGGILNITSASDAIESEKGYIQINGGSIVAQSVGDGLKTSYSETDTTISPYINIAGGTMDLTVSGNGSKGIKSKGNVTVSSGNLLLTINGSAYYDTDDKDISSSAGIKCDGNMVVSGSSIITINSSGAGGKGINVDGTLTFNGGTTSVTTTGNQFTYGSDNTAAKGIKSEGDLTVNSGTITVKTSKTEAEGIESKATIIINGGTIEVEAYDDGINAGKHIAINGGYVYSYSATNDGIDSNGTMTITGGMIISSGTDAPEEGFDCDDNTFKITGGTLVGIGGATSNPTASVSTQHSLVYGTSSVTAGQLINIQSANGKEVLTVKMPRAYQREMVLLFSSPDLQANTDYTIYTGGSVSGGTDFHGLYQNSSYSGGTSADTFTTSSILTSVGTFSSGPGGPGGDGGGPGGPGGRP